MITVLTGENSFELARELARLESTVGEAAERVSGADLDPALLPQLLSGGSLFADRRFIILSKLSENRAAWSALGDYIENLTDDAELILIEPSLDKRTKTYKTLQSVADIKEFRLWTERDSQTAERWVLAEAKRMGMIFDSQSARLLIRRSLVMPERGQPFIDQWRVMSSLEKLAVLGAVTTDAVEKYTDDQPLQNVFTLLETALKGDVSILRRLISDLESSEDPFKVFGLLTSQAFQLAALAVTNQPSAETAKAIGAHPFVLRNLEPLAKRMGQTGARRVIEALSEADEDMKLSKAPPWTLIERALVKISTMA
jgi:DNA polymerase-3 subunit delta